MNEKDLNRTIVRSLNELGWGYKISDDAQNFTGTVKKPFDYFGCTDDFFIFGESKLVKGLYSFNFNRIQPHQFESLNKVRSSANLLDYINCHALVTVGFWESRKFFYVLFFDIWAIKSLINCGKNSLTKKDIQILIDNNCHMNIKKGLVVDMQYLPHHIIYNFSALGM